MDDVPATVINMSAGGLALYGLQLLIQRFVQAKADSKVMLAESDASSAEARARQDIVQLLDARVDNLNKELEQERFKRIAAESLVEQLQAKLRMEATSQ